MKSSIYCGHANERPQACPCNDDCSCRSGMCRGKAESGGLDLARLTTQQREALAYVSDMVRRNPLELCQDSVSKRHTAMVRLAVETLDRLLDGKVPS